MLLPCDDPEWSNFTKFFAQNFERFGLKKLISTSYAVESKNALVDATPSSRQNKETPSNRDATGASRPREHGLYYQPTLFETEAPHFDAAKTRVRGKIFVLDHGTNANGKIDIEDLEWQYIAGVPLNEQELLNAIYSVLAFAIHSVPFLKTNRLRLRCARTLTILSVFWYNLVHAEIN